jgi:Family of unknown function (DUF5677)
MAHACLVRLDADISSFPVADTASQRATAVLDLVHQYLPEDVESAGEFGDWNVVAPGLIGAAAVILESIFRLPPPRYRVGAEILARSLFEYAITFAWLAAPEDETERAVRLARFEVDEYHDREVVDRRYVSVLGDKRTRYDKLIKAGKMPSGLIDAPMKSRIAERRNELQAKNLPDLLELAIQADDRWFDVVNAVECIPFAHIYGIGYADYSFVSHPSPTAISRVVTGDGIVRVGEPAGATTAHRLSVSVFAVMLVIASRTVGWPPESAVYQAATLG